jgi:hypothetical protein
VREFNTLQAQRESAEAYVRSQVHVEGRRSPSAMTMEDSRARTWSDPHSASYLLILRRVRFGHNERKRMHTKQEFALIGASQ